MKQRIPALLLLIGLLVLGGTWGLRQISDMVGDPRIHAGSSFTPGASAMEEGTLTTAVQEGGKDMVRAESPTAEWRAAYPQAVCVTNGVEVCTSEATVLPTLGSKIGGGVAGVLGGALVLYFLWEWLEEIRRRDEMAYWRY